MSSSEKLNTNDVSVLPKRGDIVAKRNRASDVVFKNANMQKAYENLQKIVDKEKIDINKLFSI